MMASGSRYAPPQESPVKQGEKFTDERVRWVKGQLVEGVHPRALARFLRVSLNTVLRIKNGETYLHVQVEGEEMLRPGLAYMKVDVGGLDEGSGIKRPVATSMVSTITEEEVDEMEKRLLVFQGEVDAKGGPKALEGVSPEVAAQAKRMLGL